ncbi:DegT/DnrJ/EryC1/StrS family aminotransferase [Bacillus pacificus]
MTDAAHAFGAERNGLKCGQVADFTCYSFHAVKKFNYSRRWRGCLEKWPWFR